MTLSSTVSKVSYAGDDATVAFAFGYYFLADADLVVTLSVDATGVETVQTITTNYTVAGATVPSGGTVTMVTAPATGETLVIKRTPSITQGLDLVENDPFPSDQVEQAFDRAAMIAQSADEEFDRLVGVQISDTYNGGIPYLPIQATRASKLLSFDANGDMTASTVAEFGAVVASDATPEALGTAAAGTDTTYSRGDHVHSDTGVGDVAGPASSTDSSLAKFDGTTGKLLKDGAVIGTDVQAYDADTLFADTPDTLTAGFAGTVYDAGTKTTGTFTPDEANGNMQKAVSGGAHTLTPPTNDTTIVLQYTNDASAGAVTTSGFTLVNGDDLTTTNGDDFFLYITKNNGFSHLNVLALQ